MNEADTHSGIAGFLFGGVFGALAMFLALIYQPPSVRESEVIDRGFAHYHVITKEFIWHKRYTIIEDEGLSLRNLQDDSPQ